MATDNGWPTGYLVGSPIDFPIGCLVDSSNSFPSDFPIGSSIGPITRRRPLPFRCSGRGSSKREREIPSMAK